MKSRFLKRFAPIAAIAWGVLASTGAPPSPAFAQEIKLAPDRVPAIAKQAYIYGFPLVDNYRILYAYTVDKANPEYKGPFNQVISTARVYTPSDRAIQTPNSDTPYSFAELDLRAEPMVVTLPKIERNRYYSVQMVDLYTFNFDYLGTRTTGNDGGSFLVVGPRWKGPAPAGIKKISRSGTDLAMLIYRTQLFNAADLPNVKKIQAGYKLQPLSAYLKQAPPTPAPAIHFIKPLNSREERSSLQFFNILAFVLQFCPADPSEVALRRQFAEIGIDPGKTFDPARLSPNLQAAFKRGMDVGQREIDTAIASAKSASNFFGTRAFLKNDFLNRAAGAQSGIYGNSKEEAFYVPYKFDAARQLLNASKNRYALHFDAGKLPPANAFWSITMYDRAAQLLVANPINRYLINSPMLSELKKDEDGGVTIYLQKDSPGKDKETNWLPAPNSIFYAVLRIYEPKPEVLNGAWRAPPIFEVK